MLLEAVVCHRGSEKADALIAGEPVCEGILVAVYIVAAFAKVSAVVDICGAIGVTTSGCWSVGVMLVSLFSIYFLDSVLIFFYR